MDVFEQLTVLPSMLSRVQESLSPVLWRVRSGPFAFVEHCWHLADLERRGFGTRIERLLAEAEPFLPDFDGERIALERQYLVLSVDAGIAAFVAARGQNLATLRAIAPGQWERSGMQEQVGRLMLADLPRRILDHDRAHANEIADLLTNLAPGHPCIAELRNGGPATSRAA
jgi:DinB superfamily